MAPFNTDWNIWGLAWWHETLPSHDRLYDIHDSRYYKMKPGYRDLLRGMDNLWVLPRMARKLKAHAYPLARVRALRGRNYFASSVAYMIAHAILLQPDEIGVWGVDMAEDGEYAHQRPNAEWWLAFAEGRGIKITIPRESALLKAPYVYGQERPKIEGDLYKPESALRKYLDNQVALCGAGLERFKYDERNYLKMKGGQEAFEAARTTLDCFERGAQVEHYGEIKIP